MSITRRQAITHTAAVAATASPLAAPWVHAQTLPTGPIRIIVGFAPGGGTDILARAIGQRLQAMWNTSVVVENRAGAAGVLAADYVAKQPNDGSTLLMAHINSHALAPALGQRMGYNVEADFTPIVMVGVTPNLLVCNEQQKSRTLAELIAECKAQPGRLTFGSSGPGSAQHFALELFKFQAKVFALHIPYRGSGPVITDLIAGQINYGFETMTAASPHVRGGRLRAIAQTRQQRSKAWPQVPTAAEAGLPGFEATTWYGVAGPARMNPALLARMNEDINKAMAHPEVAERMASSGAEDGGGTPERFADFMRAERAKYTKLVKDAGIKIDS